MTTTTDSTSYLASKIEESYYANKRSSGRCLIADVRLELAYPKAEFDAAFESLVLSGKASAFPFDDPREINEHASWGSWKTPSGNVRHIFYMGQMG